MLRSLYGILHACTIWKFRLPRCFADLIMAPPATSCCGPAFSALLLWGEEYCTLLCRFSASDLGHSWRPRGRTCAALPVRAHLPLGRTCSPPVARVLFVATCSHQSCAHR